MRCCTEFVSAIPESSTFWCIVEGRSGGKSLFYQKGRQVPISGGGSTGGAVVWLNPGLAECGQVRGVLHVGLVNDTETCHIATLL